MIPCDCTGDACPAPDRGDWRTGRGQDRDSSELIRRSSFCNHLQILSESAGIVFGGGFPAAPAWRGAKPRSAAIFYVQRGARKKPPSPVTPQSCCATAERWMERPTGQAGRLLRGGEDDAGAELQSLRRRDSPADAASRQRLQPPESFTHRKRDRSREVDVRILGCGTRIRDGSSWMHA